MVSAQCSAVRGVRASAVQWSADSVVQGSAGQCNALHGAAAVTSRC